jgi:hypothetical protein
MNLKTSSKPSHCGRFYPPPGLSSNDQVKTSSVSFFMIWNPKTPFMVNHEFVKRFICDRFQPTSGKPSNDQ